MGRIGLFLDSRYEKKGNKEYLVVRPTSNRMPWKILAALLILLLATFFAPVFLDSILKVIKYPFSFWVASNLFTLGLFGIGCLLLMREQLKPSIAMLIARIKGKEVKQKGGFTVFNRKNPVEQWIEL